ncbi:MAG: NAD(P)/FAD-dependent oxidoreductase, partial [Acutalibacteraceae bacterium]
MLYERNRKNDVSYPWHDYMAPATFARIGMPVPPENIAKPKDKDWTFIPPNKKTSFSMKVPEDRRDVSVMRRPFNDWLYERAKDYAEIHYETAVKRVICENGKVRGVELADDTRISADLVIDCGGANSCVRENLPKELGIERKLDTRCTFQVKRTSFKRN